MPTIPAKLKNKSYIFQPGNIVTLDDQLLSGTYEGNETEGYWLPDTGEGEPGILPEAHIEIGNEVPEQAEEHFGKCILTLVKNYADPNIEKALGAKEVSGEVKTHQVQMIHYPDCQQIVFHMPEFAWYAHEICLHDKVTRTDLFRVPVREKLSGSTMISLDTLPYKPGFYSIKANWPNGWTHELHFIKMIPGFPFEEIYHHPDGNLTMVQNDKEYRLYDSNKVEIVNEVQQKAEALKAIFGKRVLYAQDGRGGTIEYVDGDVSITFDWEFAGGNGVVIIFIPTPTQWEAATKTKASERQGILEFVAMSAIRDKAPGCRYEISDNFLDIKY